MWHSQCPLRPKSERSVALSRSDAKGHFETSCAATKWGSDNGIGLVVPNLRQHLSGMSILAQLASDDVLESAYEWLCRRRWDYSANSDIWSFRRCWQREKLRIKGELPAWPDKRIGQGDRSVAPRTSAVPGPEFISWCRTLSRSGTPVLSNFSNCCATTGRLK